MNDYTGYAGKPYNTARRSRTRGEEVTEQLAGELIYYSQRLRPDFYELEVIPIADVHYGNPLFSEHHLLKTREYVLAQDNRYVVLNGDLCESVTKASKGDMNTQRSTPQEQRDYIINYLLPIKDRILAMTTGNHERRIYNEVGVDLSKDIAEKLGVPYRADGVLLKVSFGSGNESHKEKPYVYWIYATHGYGGARTKSAKAVKVERLGTWIHADVYIMSHDHVVNAAPDVYLLPDNRTHEQRNKDGMATGFVVGKVVAKRKMLVKTSAYLKWGGYSEAGGFPPVDLMPPVIKFSGEGKPEVRVEI